MTVVTVKLEKVVDILSGFAFKSELFNNSEGMPIIRIRDVVRGFSKTCYSGEFDNSFLVQNDETVIGMDGNFNVAKWKGGPALLNQRVCKIKAREGILDDDYLFHFLPKALKKIEDSTPFVTVKHLSVKGVKEIDIPLPPIPEQRRIATILDQADALRAKRREALALLDSLTQSIFMDMFGDPATNTKRWDSTPLETITTKITDGEHQTPKRTESGIKLLSARNIRDGYLDFGDVDFIDTEEHQKISKRCNPEFGDILISCSGSIGRVAIIETNEPLGLVRSAALVKPNHQMVSSKYLETYLRTPYMNQMMIKKAHSSSQANLFQGPIRALPVILPPVSLQQEFASKAASLQQLKASHYESCFELDTLFASLQHRAFRGEL